MKASKLRVITAGALLLLVTVGFVTTVGLGTSSAIGWFELSIICPLGALGTLLATKMLVPQALISLVLAVICIALFARAFCAWFCPVPLVEKLRGLFSRKKPDSLERALRTPQYLLAGKEPGTADLRSTDLGTADLGGTDSGLLDAAVPSAAVPNAAEPRITDPRATESRVVESCATKTCASGACASSGCSSCGERRGKALDTRHFVLGGSLLSTAVFGFPVFCLICPIGLSFATILLVIRLFSGGDVTLSLIIVPLVLLAEVVFFKKWCGKICPLSAFMSLVGKVNRTFRPTIKNKSCLESSQGKSCGVCAKVCPEGIDPRHPELGSAWSECTLCRECVDACPTKSLTMPLLAKKKEKEKA